MSGSLTTSLRYYSRGIGALFATGILCMAGSGYGQDLRRPIRFIVPFPPGGATDVISRLVGGKLFQSTGQQVIIDNRAGGATVVGTELAARSAPDSHTMLLGTFGFAVTPALHRELPYDTLRDFAPVTLIAQGLLVLLAHPSTQASSVGELIALAKSRPAQLNYASVGGGTSTSLAGLLFRSMTGAKIVEVPYQGSGLSMSALVSGEVQIAFASSVAALPFLKAGKLRALGVTSVKRSSLLPDVPTISEAGVPGYALTQWYGILLPARAPESIVSKLNGEVVRILQQPDVRDVFTTQGLEPSPSSPVEFSRFIAAEIKKWTAVLRANSSTY